MVLVGRGLPPAIATARACARSLAGRRQPTKGSRYMVPVRPPATTGGSCPIDRVDSQDEP
jgi:hypothetical protein